jgi:hypothetical protein
VALDGSKVKANASKHKAMSDGRMREKQKQLCDEVAQLLAQAEAADAAKDAEYGADRLGDELPAELQRRERTSAFACGFGGQPSRGLPSVAHAVVGKRERRLERATGIEPVSEAWEASVLPLY